MDINGLAGSVELYLGKDVLRMEHDYAPVQWTGYIKSIEQYQGEILEKDTIQDRFRRKLETCINDTTNIHNYDWDGIRLIWEEIFKNCAA